MIGDDSNHHYPKEKNNRMEEIFILNIEAYICLRIYVRIQIHKTAKRGMKYSFIFEICIN